MRYKLCNFCENRARDTHLRSIYIPHFGQIWVKISILGVLHPCPCTDGGWNLARRRGPSKCDFFAPDAIRWQAIHYRALAIGLHSTSQAMPDVLKPWRSPPPCQISPHRCNVSPLRGEKPQNRPLSKLNTGRFALRAMLPVKTPRVSKQFISPQNNQYKNSTGDEIANVNVFTTTLYM